MSHRVHHPHDLIYSEGTKIVLLKDLLGRAGAIEHARGTVGVVIKSPVDKAHSYRVRFLDDTECMLRADELTMLARFKEGDLTEIEGLLRRAELFDRVIVRCIVGSRAYGLEDAGSDTDRRGIYLPSADAHWSLFGVPEQIENDATQETYWELQKFVVLALKANPNILECLYSPLIEKVTPIGQRLIDMRHTFLSKMVYQTYNGYVTSQFRKMQADIRNHGSVKWKHVMHLIRLLLSGITALKDGFVPTRVNEHRDELLAIKAGLMDWEELNRWRLALHTDFDKAYEISRLPERPDYEQANRFLIDARRAALAEELP